MGKSSFIYTATSFLQKGFLLFLLPVFTRYLTPSDYGILAVVTGISSVLTIILTLCLNSAMTRFYFEFREDPKKLEEFWGTILTFMMLTSVVGGGALLVVGRYLLKPLTGQIPFWPCIALGIGAVIFQPFFALFLALLQTKEQARRYAWYSFAQFAINVALVLLLVVLLRWGAVGSLAATLITAAIFFIVSLYSLRDDFAPCLRLNHLKVALVYSLPLVPHMLSWQALVIADRLMLNSMVSTAAAGIYSVGFMIGSVMNYVTDGVNKAYVPIAMDVLKARDKGRLDELKGIALLLVVVYSLLAAFVSIFSGELVRLFTARAFYESYEVIPFIAFGFTLTGIYSIFVNILFFETAGVKFVPVGTAVVGLSNVALNIALIPRFGIVGAGVAHLVSQSLGLLFVALIARRFEAVRWDYLKFAGVFVCCLAVSLLALHVPLSNPMGLFTIKVALYAFVFLLLNKIVWGDGYYILRHGLSFARAVVKVS